MLGKKKKAIPSEVVPGDCLSIATGSQVRGGCTVHGFLLLILFSNPSFLHLSSRSQSHIFQNFQHSQYIHAAFPMKSHRWVYGAGTLSFSTLGTSLFLPSHREGQHKHTDAPAITLAQVRQVTELTELAGLFQAVL